MMMRFVFIGSNPITLSTARMMLEEGFDVVIIERDKDRAEELTDMFDCGILHGDGSAPEILEQADPQSTTALFSLLDNEQTNIIVALLARSLKFKRVIPLVSDSIFEKICTELGLEDTVAPNREVARNLINMIKGEKNLDLSALIHLDAEVYSFIVTENEAIQFSEFELPQDYRIICIYRNDKMLLPHETESLVEDDEVLLITHTEHLPALKKHLKSLQKR